MSWINQKFEEQRQAEELRLKEQAEAEARRRAAEEKMVATWGRLVHTVEQDVRAYNSHPHATRRLLVTVLDNSLELHWEEDYGPLLLVELNLDQHLLKYSTPVHQPEKWRAHIGEIKFGTASDLLVPNGSSGTKSVSIGEASRFLLEPVLF